MLWVFVVYCVRMFVSCLLCSLCLVSCSVSFVDIGEILSCECNSEVLILWWCVLLMI